jgi:frataxin-like iron-binding protein CyaY
MSKGITVIERYEKGGLTAYSVDEGETYHQTVDEALKHLATQLDDSKNTGKLSDIKIVEKDWLEEGEFALVPPNTGDVMTLHTKDDSKNTGNELAEQIKELLLWNRIQYTEKSITDDKLVEELTKYIEQQVLIGRKDQTEWCLKVIEQERANIAVQEYRAKIAELEHLIELTRENN